MKQIDYCPFVESKYQECEIPTCDTCYLNCIHKPISFKESVFKAVNNKPITRKLSVSELVNKFNSDISNK